MLYPLDRGDALTLPVALSDRSRAILSDFDMDET